MISIQDLTDRLKAEARRIGFDQLGVAPAVSAPGFVDFLDWVERGHAADMSYLTRDPSTRRHPASVLDSVQSVIMASVVYGRNEPPGQGATPAAPSQGKVARYARGADYHQVLWDKLDALLAWLTNECPTIRGRAVADTAPLLERDFARLAGLGWIGKNTMLIDRRLGSFTFLGALLIDAPLAYDVPQATNHCGKCTRCLDACPTDAFSEPYRLDAGRCISYWTIEQRGPLAEANASRLDGWVFGCDICQDVCPWNRKAPAGRLAEFDARSEWVNPDLVEWLTRDPVTWSAALKGTALRRAKRAGLVRNAALVLGGRRVAEAFEPLRSRLDDRNEDQGIRAAAAWALGQIGGSAAVAALEQHRGDADPIVAAAVERACDSLAGSPIS